MEIEGGRERERERESFNLLNNQTGRFYCRVKGCEARRERERERERVGGSL